MKEDLPRFRVRLGDGSALGLRLFYAVQPNPAGIADTRATAKEIIWLDQLMVIFSRHIQHKKAGATFVSEVKYSQVMYNDIRAHSGNAVM